MFEMSGLPLSFTAQPPVALQLREAAPVTLPTSPRTVAVMGRGREARGHGGSSGSRQPSAKRRRTACAPEKEQAGASAEQAHRRWARWKRGRTGQHMHAR